MEACSCGTLFIALSNNFPVFITVLPVLPHGVPEGIRVAFLHCLAALGTIVMASSTPVPLMGGDNMLDCIDIGLPAFLILVIVSQCIQKKIIYNSIKLPYRSGLISAAPCGQILERGIMPSVPKENDKPYTSFFRFNNIVQALFSSPASVAIIVAYFLDLTVSRGERSTCRDSGRHWCQKFRTFNQDSRTEDFSIHSLQTWADISPHIECTSILI
ncbi:Nucleobase-ascorbate transporter 4 [Glycine soja]|uniref:Nucleobase-ascorbate transporter 4 n=1 Tax=Glycine soja TaxID=3848 RepID=A0A445F4N9_GLYSO|nr:Nucleobase-ascorbate transporter 4 [Glycine soja]